MQCIACGNEVSWKYLDGGVCEHCRLTKHFTNRECTHCFFEQMAKAAHTLEVTAARSVRSAEQEVQNA